jgi:hypothetical protein
MSRLNDRPATLESSDKRSLTEEGTWPHSRKRRFPVRGARDRLQYEKEG